MTVLVLLTAAARTWFVASDTGHIGRSSSLSAGLSIHNGLHLTGLGGGGVHNVGDVLCLAFDLLGSFIQMVGRLNTPVHEHARDFILHAVKQLAKQLEGLAFVCLA